MESKSCNSSSSVVAAGCRYDGTVRTANGSVVQFLYGEDGMDGTAIEAQKLENLRMTPAKFKASDLHVTQSQPMLGTPSVRRYPRAQDGHSAHAMEP